MLGSCLEPALPEAPLDAELSEDNMETLSLKAESLSGLSVRAVKKNNKITILTVNVSLLLGRVTYFHDKHNALIILYNNL